MAVEAGRSCGDVALLDLGELQEPVLLFGGAYSNLQALEALLKAAGDLKIPASHTIHTGDVVAYCAQPRETSELLRSSGVCCLMGNCEESIGSAKLDCGCGFPENSACSMYSVNWYAYVMKQLANCEDLRAWMADMPRQIRFRLGGKRFAVVHGSPRHISEFVWPSSPDEVLLAAMEEVPPEIDAIIGGHSGLPFARLVPSASPGSSKRQRLWINSGVIGMPANDGTQRAWYAVLLPVAGGGVEVSFQTLDYDAAQAADLIHRQPALVRGYGDALLTGVWPSHDIMPLEEQMKTGVANAESTLRWAPQRDSGTAGDFRGSGRHLSQLQAVSLLSVLAAGAAALMSAWLLHGRRKLSV